MATSTETDGEIDMASSSDESYHKVLVVGSSDSDSDVEEPDE